MLVIDASALTDLVLARPSAAHIEAHITRHGYELHAPHLLDVEALSAVRALAAAGEASAERARQALTDLAALPITRYPHDILLARAWQLRDNFSAYDAMYVALAEALTDGGAPLLTSDERLARAARSHTGVQVLVAA